jgi:hypothetical protein
VIVIARSVATKQSSASARPLDCFASLAMTAFAFVINGLDPVIHLFEMMDTRVKPAYDEVG